jgi:hypothetical protein
MSSPITPPVPITMPSPPNWDDEEVFTWYSGSEEPGSTNLTAKDARVTATARIGADDYYNVVMGLLGYSYIDSVPTLHRVIPMAHPFWSNLNVVQLSNLRGVKFNGQEDSIANMAGLIGPAEGPLYKYYKHDVEFGMLPFDPTPDADTAAEYERYTSFKSTPRGEFIQRQGGYLVFAEQGGAGGAGSGKGPPAIGLPNGTQFTGKQSVIERKRKIEFTWHQVPEEWVADVSNWAIIYPKIDACIGTVNNATFLGAPAGCLLLTDVLPVRTPSALKTSTGYETAFYCDITFFMTYFRPPAGAGSSAIGQGHNLKPFFDQSISGTSGNPPPVYYYWADMLGNGTGMATYQAADFSSMFTYWNS